MHMTNHRGPTCCTNPSHFICRQIPDLHENKKRTRITSIADTEQQATEITQCFTDGDHLHVKQTNLST